MTGAIVGPGISAPPYTDGMGFARIYVDNVDYTTRKVDTIVGVSTATSAVQVTLLTASMFEGKFVTVNDEGGNAGTLNITVATEGTETIDGANTATINTNYDSIHLYSDGSDWFTF